jgi:hypothetical protein
MKAIRYAAAALFLSCSPAFSAFIVYTAALNGANENPPVLSPGTGFAEVDVDTIANTMRVLVTFSNLTSGTSASHIHCCVAPGGNAGVATTTPTFTGFPLSVTSGSYDFTFNMLLASSYNPAFITANGGTVAAAEAALFNGINAGNTYLNIHTTTNPGGEIRGFLVAAPEPATWMLAGAALAGLMLRRRKR